MSAPFLNAAIVSVCALALAAGATLAVQRHDAAVRSAALAEGRAQARAEWDAQVAQAQAQVNADAKKAKFLPDSFACRTGKGTQRAVARAQYFVRATPPTAGG